MVTNLADGSSARSQTALVTVKGGLSGGAIAGIVIGCLFIFGTGGLVIYWFVIKKKKFADLFGKKKNIKNVFYI